MGTAQLKLRSNSFYTNLASYQKHYLMTINSKELIELVNQQAVEERLKIVEAVLKNIREEKKEATNPQNILAFAGIFKEEEALLFEEAVTESRKIDANEW